MVQALQKVPRQGAITGSPACTDLTGASRPRKQLHKLRLAAQVAREILAARIIQPRQLVRGAEWCGLGIIVLRARWGAAATNGRQWSLRAARLQRFHACVPRCTLRQGTWAGTYLAAIIDLALCRFHSISQVVGKLLCHLRRVGGGGGGGGAVSASCGSLCEVPLPRSPAHVPCVAWGRDPCPTAGAAAPQPCAWCSALVRARAPRRCCPRLLHCTPHRREQLQAHLRLVLPRGHF